MKNRKNGDRRQSLSRLTGGISSYGSYGKAGFIGRKKLFNRALFPLRHWHEILILRIGQWFRDVCAVGRLITSCDFTAVACDAECVSEVIAAAVSQLNR
jgi:hypothetical protein